MTEQLTTHYNLGNYLKEIYYKHRVLKSNIRAEKAVMETGKHGAETQTIKSISRTSIGKKLKLMFCFFFFCLSAQDLFSRKESSSLTLARGKARSLTYSLTGLHLMEKNSSKANAVFLRRQNIFLNFFIKFSEYQYFQNISELTTLKIQPWMRCIKTFVFSKLRERTCVAIVPKKQVGSAVITYSKIN